MSSGCELELKVKLVAPIRFLSKRWHLVRYREMVPIKIPPSILACESILRRLFRLCQSSMGDAAVSVCMEVEIGIPVAAVGSTIIYTAIGAVRNSCL